MSSIRNFVAGVINEHVDTSDDADCIRAFHHADAAWNAIRSFISEACDTGMITIEESGELKNYGLQKWSAAMRRLG